MPGTPHCDKKITTTPQQVDGFTALTDAAGNVIAAISHKATNGQSKGASNVTIFNFKANLISSILVGDLNTHRVENQKAEDCKEENTRRLFYRVKNHFVPKA